MKFTTHFIDFKLLSVYETLLEDNTETILAFASLKEMEIIKKNSK